MLLIGNGRVITRDEQKPYIENGAVLIDGNLIKKIGESTILKTTYPQAEWIDAKGGVIMPAFINTFTLPWQEVFPSMDMPQKVF